MQTPRKHSINSCTEAATLGFSKNPSTTIAIKVALDSGTGKPINHSLMVAPWASREKGKYRKTAYEELRDRPLLDCPY
jgi:hypothetical protein